MESIKYRELSKEELEKGAERLILELVRNDVAYELAEEIAERIKEVLLGRKIKRIGDNVEELIKSEIQKFLKEEIPENSFELEEGIREAVNEGKLYKVMFIGVNGSGKTTTIAKIAYKIREKYPVLMVCSDTYRAGAIEQLIKLAERLKVRYLKSEYGADPAAVAYDAVKHAESRGIKVVLVDTAGRMQTDRNLMEELRKIKRVLEPQLTIFVFDALAGNDALRQARDFMGEVGFDVAVATRIDADTKGGALLSVLYSVKRPVVYLGVGTEMGALIEFNRDKYLGELLGRI